MEKILVTGATGFIGSFLCKELLEDRSKELYLLVRDKGSKSAKARIKEVLETLMGKEQYQNSNTRVHVFVSNIQEKYFGLQEKEYQFLKENINTIYHCAASIKFSLTYEEASEINIGVTLKILEFIEEIPRNQFNRLNYVSTAYIAGDLVHGFKEKDLDVNQNFNNTYEKTKFECEKLLKKYMNKEYPITIYRPSIVSSSSLDGSTHESNIILIFVKLFARYKLSTFLCNEESSINIVPVDYFIKSMIFLSEEQDTCCRTFHLTNCKNIRVKDLVKQICKYFNVKVPEFVDLKNGNLKKVEKSPFYHFYNYINLSHEFDNQETRELLMKQGIYCSIIDEEYININLDYCSQNEMI